MLTSLLRQIIEYVIAQIDVVAVHLVIVPVEDSPPKIDELDAFVLFIDLKPPDIVRTLFDDRIDHFQNLNRTTCCHFSSPPLLPGSHSSDRSFPLLIFPYRSGHP